MTSTTQIPVQKGDICAERERHGKNTSFHEHYSHGEIIATGITNAAQLVAAGYEVAQPLPTSTMSLSISQLIDRQTQWLDAAQAAGTPAVRWTPGADANDDWDAPRSLLKLTHETKLINERRGIFVFTTGHETVELERPRYVMVAQDQPLKSEIDADAMRRIENGRASLAEYDARDAKAAADRQSITQLLAERGITAVETGQRYDSLGQTVPVDDAAILEKRKHGTYVVLSAEQLGQILSR